MELKQLFSKANNEHKPIIGSDFDGVVTSGLVPSKGTIILTGRKKEHKEEMQKLLPNGNKIYFFPDHDKITDSNKDEIVGNWKADMVAELGLEKFYEDTKKQTKIIQEKNPYTEVVHVSHETTEDNEKELKFVIISTFGELLDVAIQLEKVEGYETKFCVPNSSYEKIGDGIVTKEKDWHRCLGKNYVWVVDGCETADLQEWLREQGEYVVGTNKVLAELEDDRKKGQEWFKKAGFHQPKSISFEGENAFDEAIKFIRENS